MQLKKRISKICETLLTHLNYTKLESIQRRNKRVETIWINYGWTITKVNDRYYITDLKPRKKMMIKKITLKTENTRTCYKVNSTISIAL